MAHVLANLVKETSVSGGPDEIELTGSPLKPYRGFAAVLSAGDTTEVMVVDRGTGKWQAAVYSYAAGVLTVDPSHFFASSTGTLIDFPAGLKDVSISMPAERTKPFARTADFTALPLFYAVDTTDAAVTALLPATPREGDEVVFSDPAGTWATNNFTVDGNGHDIDLDGEVDGELVADASDRIALAFSGGLWRVR